MTEKSERCRHNKSWFIANGLIEWCYECGAFRRLSRIEGERNLVYPSGIWIKPVGKGGENPFEKLDVPARKVKS